MDNRESRQPNCKKALVSSWLSTTGFCFLLAGPLLLYAAQVACNLFGYVFSESGAGIYGGICAVLPCVGFLMAFATLFLWKYTKKLGRALSLVTILMGNPLFLYIYILICAITTSTLANLPWM